MFEGTPPACSRLFLYMLYVSVHVKPAAASASVHFLSVVPRVFIVRAITLEPLCENEDDETERIPALTVQTAVDFAVPDL